LHRIGPQGIIIAPDFSTVLSGNADKRDAVFSDLRRIYDGHLNKEYGTATAGPHEWRGRVTFIVAVTPAVDNYSSLFQSLGERFLQVRWPRANVVDAAVAAIAQNPELVKSELTAAARTLFAGLPGAEPALLEGIQRKIAALAEFTVRARSHVARSAYGAKEITGIPEPESPTRLGQQLAQLAKGSALLDGRDTVNEDDYRLVQRAAFDNVLTTRRRLLQALIDGTALSTLKLRGSTQKYALEDLDALDLMEGPKLSELASDLLAQAGYPVPASSQAQPVSRVPKVA
jgi:hypothetical protein